MTDVQTHTGGFTATNGHLFPAPEGWIVIDAPAGMADWLAARGWKPAALFLTHWHFDHVVDAARLVREYGCPVYAWGPSNAMDRLEYLLAPFLGDAVKVEQYPVDHILAGKGDVTIAGAEFLLRHVPGHSPDSLVLIHEPSRTIFSGDTVMDGGMGRTDFPGGSFELLSQGVREKILTFPGNYRIFPGHGGVTTVAQEREGNRFLE